jgi:hypothetical protein
MLAAGFRFILPSRKERQDYYLTTLCCGFLQWLTIAPPHGRLSPFEQIIDNDRGHGEKPPLCRELPAGARQQGRTRQHCVSPRQAMAGRLASLLR